jgi:DNA invertase Pin-like site-specific DNA recombinase
MLRRSFHVRYARRTSTYGNRVRSGIAAARARGKRLGRPKREVDVSRIAALRAAGMSWRDVGRDLGVGVATARAAFQDRAKNLSESVPVHILTTFACVACTE